eukprot:c28993_g2_i1 orf=66-344(-)
MHSLAHSLVAWLSHHEIANFLAHRIVPNQPPFLLACSRVFAIVVHPIFTTIYCYPITTSPFEPLCCPTVVIAASFPSCWFPFTVLKAWNLLA